MHGFQVLDRGLHLGFKVQSLALKFQLLCLRIIKASFSSFTLKLEVFALLP